MKMKTFYAMGLVCVAGAGGVLAQSVPPAGAVSSGILNGRAVSLPLPDYPESVRQAGIGGVIAVNVVIDESGVVISAVAEVNDQRESKNADGVKPDPVPADPALREAAENAARRATFAPVSLGGRPTRIKGKILYNFIVDKSDKPPRVGEIHGPLLNGKAVSLPQPIYPEEARSASVSGSVTVQIMIDQDGNVTSAMAVNGPPLLRAAAEEAAMKAKFSPARVNRQPITVAGVLTYTFAATRGKSQ